MADLYQTSVQSDLDWNWRDEFHPEIITFTNTDVEQLDEFAEQQMYDDARAPVTKSDSGSRALDKFEARYARLLSNKKDMSELEGMDKIRQIFSHGEPSEHISLGRNHNLEGDYNREIEELKKMEEMLRDKGLYDATSADPAFVDRRNRMRQMRRAVTVAYDTLKGIGAFVGLQSNVSDAHWLNELTPEEQARERNSEAAIKSKRSKPQQLLDWLLNQLDKKQAKKKGCLVFRPKNTPSGIWTHSYEMWEDIENVIMDLVTASPDTSLQENLLTSGSGNLAFCTKFLEKTCSPRFGKLKEDRGIWSFPNGVFLGKKNATFLRWNDRRLSDSYISSKHFEDPHDPDAFFFDDDSYEAELALHNDDWMQLKTPSFQKIMETQRGMKDDLGVQRWLYTHTGRLVYDLHEADFWDVQIFYKGLGGTGKSTLLKEKEYFYQPTDVGVLGNELEENFPLESILGCNIYLAFDIGENFRLSQMIWQCMVCAETVPINRKFKTKINVVWTMPGAMAGNQPPAWNDNGGSVSRRMVIWAFLTKVTGSNPWLFDEMKLETPILLKKVLLAYIQAAERYGRCSMDACLKDIPYFEKHRNQLKQETNMLSSFIQSVHVEINQYSVCPLSAFEQAFNDYCDKKRKNRPMSFSPDFYSGIFQEFEITVSAEKKAGNYRGKNFVDYEITGLDLVAEAL